MEVIEFLDNSGNTLVKRLPENGKLEIIWGSQLTVRESQEALFFRDGQVLDVFGPGRYILETKNIPLLGKLVTSIGYGSNSPFRSEVIFVGKQLFSNLKWGTREPILFRDQELSAIRLRSFGIYSIQISDSTLFVNKVAGTRGLFKTEEIQDYFKGIIVSKLNSILAKEIKTVYDISNQIEDLNLILRNELSIEFSALGLKVHDFYIQSISVPEEVQKLIDTKSGIGALGNLDQFMKYKIATAIGDVANNQGSSGDAFNSGAGLAFGMLVPQMINSNYNAKLIGSDPLDKIKKLKELLELGAINQLEFENLKNEQLKQI